MARLGEPTPLEETREPPTSDELGFVRRRLTVVWLLFLAVAMGYLAQIYRLTVLQGPEYRDLSENNFLLQLPIPAPRGQILDRNGEPLAVNRTVFTVEMSPYRLTREQVQETLERLAALLDEPRVATLTDRVLAKRPRWNGVALANNLPLERVLPVLERSFDLPGVQVIREYRRYYPAGETAGLITGHVAAIDQRRKESYLARGYLIDEPIGWQGVEQALEEDLHGRYGVELVRRDAFGRVRGRQSEYPAVPGRTLVLSIDLGLQRLADQLLEGWQGVILAMDPRDGSVLALACRPGYDPNRPGWTGTPERPRSSFNKAVNGIGFAPGSTFKAITAAAGLLAGFSPEERTVCGGRYTLPGVGVPFPCNLRTGHGSQNMYEALQHSCNVYFYRWAHRVGGAQLLQTARQFGLGERTGFELEDAGARPPGRLAVPGVDPIYLGSVLQMGIGQGQLMTATPLQLARAYAALCNGGVLYRPTILKEVRDPDGTPVRTAQREAQGRLPLTDEQRRQILEGLWRVVNERGGTAARYGIKPEWRVAGKTGTAQTGRPRTDAWLVCFAPAEAPRILLLILVQESAHGGEICTPLARQLLAYYFGEPEPQIVPPPRQVDEAGRSDD